MARLDSGVRVRKISSECCSKKAERDLIEYPFLRRSGLTAPDRLDELKNYSAALLAEYRIENEVLVPGVFYDDVRAVIGERGCELLLIGCPLPVRSLVLPGGDYDQRQIAQVP